MCLMGVCLLLSLVFLYVSATGTSGAAAAGGPDASAIATGRTAATGAPTNPWRPTSPADFPVPRPRSGPIPAKQIQPTHPRGQRGNPQIQKAHKNKKKTKNQ